MEQYVGEEDVPKTTKGSTSGMSKGTSATSSYCRITLHDLLDQREAQQKSDISISSFAWGKEHHRQQQNRPSAQLRNTHQQQHLLKLPAIESWRGHHNSLLSFSRLSSVHYQVNSSREIRHLVTIFSKHILCNRLLLAHTFTLRLGPSSIALLLLLLFILYHLSPLHQRASPQAIERCRRTASTCQRNLATVYLKFSAVEETWRVIHCSFIFEWTNFASWRQLSDELTN